VDEDSALGLDRGADSPDLVSRQIVDHDDVAIRQAWRQDLIDIGPEGFAVYRAVQNEGGDEPIAAQSGREGGGFPMPPMGLADQPPGAATPSHALAASGNSHQFAAAQQHGCFRSDADIQPAASTEPNL